MAMTPEALAANQGTPEQRNAFERLRQTLAFWGLETMTEDVWQELVAGTPEEAMMNFIFRHPVFENRFPTIRDPETGAFVMSPAEWVTYEDNLASTLGTYGFDPESFGVTFAELTSTLIAQRRSVREVSEDLEIFAELDDDPFLRREFFAITGQDPGTEGLFALALGLPEGNQWRQVYERAAQQGVDREEAARRFAEFEPPATRERPRPLSTTIFAADMVTDPETGEEVSRAELFRRHGTSNPKKVSTQPWWAIKDPLQSAVVRFGGLDQIPHWHKQFDAAQERLGAQPAPEEPEGPTTVPQPPGGIGEEGEPPGGVQDVPGGTPENPRVGPVGLGPDAVVARVERIRALRRAREAAEAQFQAGGRSIVAQELRPQTF